jgi:hypothetical protein
MLLFSHLPHTTQPVYQLCALIKHGLFWVWVSMRFFNLKSRVCGECTPYRSVPSRRQPLFPLLGNRLFGNLSFGFRHGIHHKTGLFSVTV